MDGSYIQLQRRAEPLPRARRDAAPLRAAQSIAQRVSLVGEKSGEFSSSERVAVRRPAAAIHQN